MGKPSGTLSDLFKAKSKSNLMTAQGPVTAVAQGRVVLAKSKMMRFYAQASKNLEKKLLSLKNVRLLKPLNDVMKEKMQHRFVQNNRNNRAQP